jgi:hypothetical protein
MSAEASITVNQEGVKTFAPALLNVQEYEIFIDGRKVGVLDGYQNRNVCAVPAGPHSIYVRAYARDSTIINRVYGYSQTLDVNLSAGENKRFSCGVVAGPPLRKALILSTSLITILLFLGVGPIGDIPQRARYASAMVMALITMASSWYGYSSKPGASIYLKEG